MEDKKVLTLIDNEGNKKEYEIILVFKWLKTKKYYIVYTDNSKNENDELNVFAAIFYPDDTSRLDPIETDEEWDEIDNRLKKMVK